MDHHGSGPLVYLHSAAGGILRGIAEMPKILVAEDDPSLAHVYGALLSQWNCETVVEHTGIDALRRAATFRPDVALLGVVMPEMSGVEAAIKLLEICPGVKIALVAERVPPSVLERLNARGYYFETLPAPFSHEELHGAIFGRSYAGDGRY